MFNAVDSVDSHPGPENHPSVLTLETPDIEDIARVIWQRQHDALASSSNARHWRDKAIPSKFWNEFLLDARAVLALLQKEHVRFRKKRAGHLSSGNYDAGNYDAGDLRAGA